MNYSWASIIGIVLLCLILWFFYLKLNKNTFIVILSVLLLTTLSIYYIKISCPIPTYIEYYSCNDLSHLLESVIITLVWIWLILTTHQSQRTQLTKNILIFSLSFLIVINMIMSLWQYYSFYFSTSAATSFDLKALTRKIFTWRYTSNEKSSV